MQLFQIFFLHLFWYSMKWKHCMLLVHDSPLFKVRIFWEGHKIWKNLPLKIWCYWVASNFKWKVSSNFVAFSKYPNFTNSLFFFRLMWIYYIIQLQFKRVFVPQFTWEMFVKRQWSIPSNPCNKSGSYLNESPKMTRNCQIFYFPNDNYSKEPFHIMSVHFWTLLDPPTLC